MATGWVNCLPIAMKALSSPSARRIVSSFPMCLLMQESISSWPVGCILFFVNVLLRPFGGMAWKGILLLRGLGVNCFIYHPATLLQ